MQQTLNFLNILDSTIKRTKSNTKPSGSLREKTTFRKSRFPYAKALNFNLRECEYKNEQLYPKWLTQKKGFLDFMYNHYQKKLMSIPQICEKEHRASDQKYFLGLYLQQLHLFSTLPHAVSELILDHMKTQYFKAGETVHSGGKALFQGVIFAGILVSKTHKEIVTYEKNQIVMPGCFYDQSYDPLQCKEEAIILTLDRGVYSLIVRKLRQDIEDKERDQINDMLKSTFFTELHLKDKKAYTFFEGCQLRFYLDGQTIAEAGSEVSHFYLIFRGEVTQENHIYIREHNKWPLPARKWEVRAVYNSYHKENKIKRFGFFGDEEIMTNNKFKSRYIASGWVILFVMEAEKFIALLTAEEGKRLKKFRNENVEINYGQFQLNIRKRVRSLSQQRNIVKKAISGSLARRDNLTPRKMSMISNFQKTMLSKTFFEKGSQINL